MFESNKVSKNQNKQNDSVMQLVTFKIGEEEYAVDILNVQEINRMVAVTKVPAAPEFVEGIINLRGKVIPIIDLRRRFGFPQLEADKSTRIIVVELSSSVVGFIVDSVSEVLRINSSVTEPPPDIVMSISTDYITAVGKLDDRLLILLDLERVLSNSEKKILETIK